MCDVSGVCRKACCLRQINTTGNLRMADLRDLPVGQNQNLVVIAGRLWETSLRAKRSDPFIRAKKE
jgi:hypothetical protein